MQATARRDTPPELEIRSLLYRRGYRYRVDMSPLANHRSRADIVFTRLRVAVYIDGCFWHGCPLHGTWPKVNGEWWRNKIEANRQRDREATAVLLRAGWSVLRIWEHEEPESALNLIVAELQSKSC
jgi:DNA mismatch endonuclease (patch repair protein)